MDAASFKLIAPEIPHLPGVYKYFDQEQNIIYVGKAKDLRKRVSSYFYKSVTHRKTLVMVRLIAKIEFTVTENEHDAFLLESSLIKHLQPKYNIDLKDDKSYPYIVFKKEHFPRVFLTRTLVKDGSEYIGPFTSVYSAKELLNVIKENIPLRNCTLNLNPKIIARGKYKVCLEYHLGNCKGPCEGYQSELDYNNSLMNVRKILKGNIVDVIKDLKIEMQGYASNLAFEKAEQIKYKINALQNYQQKSVVVNPRLNNIDIITRIDDEDVVYVNYMMVLNGSIVHEKTISIHKKTGTEEISDILAHAYLHFYDTLNSQATEVVSTEVFELPKSHMLLTQPKLGDKLRLIEMSMKNAQIFKNTIRQRKVLMINEPTQNELNQVLEEIRIAFKMSKLPKHIECFDNSNFQGSFPVSAMVCFRNGRPYKADYRHFKVKTVEGIDDFATMKEVVYRRYKRLLEEGVSLPQLIIIDGGKGQLGAALESLNELGMRGITTIVGLAKREESIFFPGDKDPLQLPFDSAGLKLIRSIRDEVHRFGITFHRNLRSKGTLKNELESIKGIGIHTADQLLKEFKSITKIKNLTERELTKVVGASKATIIFNHFKNQI
jgi:excinuclease ABC subunit C